MKLETEPLGVLQGDAHGVCIVKPEVNLFSLTHRSNGSGFERPWIDFPDVSQVV